ncbi:hypothetical protein ARMSODRAFT_474966 [Armillaria solidipes]|uniref:Uncharacterized protein n=1 Tax=Armillaria solidipes TaxID=1076256 RepID=A0A2H3AZR8_9AGAR|nr:hypothetical protein ARMSODRAFT_474966 [Armillaria solidipes]
MMPRLPLEGRNVVGLASTKDVWGQDARSPKHCALQLLGARTGTLWRDTSGTNRRLKRSPRNPVVFCRNPVLVLAGKTSLSLIVFGALCAVKHGPLGTLSIPRYRVTASFTRSLGSLMTHSSHLRRRRNLVRRASSSERHRITKGRKYLWHVRVNEEPGTLV